MSFDKLWRICTSCTPTPYINTCMWYKGSTDLQQSQRINFFLLEIQEKQLKSQAWSFYSASRQRTRLRSGKRSCQVKPNEGLMWVGGGGLVVVAQKIFENGNWETCSRGPCETQQNLYSLHAVGGPFSTSYPLKLIKSLNVKSEESSITRLTIFGRKKYKQIFTPEKSIKSTFSLKKYKVYKSGSTALCMNRFLHIFQGLIQHLIHIIELYKSISTQPHGTLLLAALVLMPALHTEITPTNWSKPNYLSQLN